MTLFLQAGSLPAAQLTESKHWRYHMWPTDILVAVIALPSRSWVNVLADVHGLLGPVPFTVIAWTRALYSDAGDRPTAVKKVAHTRLPSVGFRSWSRFLAVSLQVMWVINPAVKVKFSHIRYRALGPELIPVYRQSARRWREVNYAIYLAVVCHCFLPGLWLPS